METTTHILLLGAGKSSLMKQMAMYFSHTNQFQFYTDPQAQVDFDAAWGLVDWSEGDLGAFTESAQQTIQSLLAAKDIPRKLVLFTQADKKCPLVAEKNEIVSGLRAAHGSAFYDQGGYFSMSFSVLSNFNLYKALGMSMRPYESPVEWFDYGKNVARRSITSFA